MAHYLFVARAFGWRPVMIVSALPQRPSTPIPALKGLGAPLTRLRQVHGARGTTLGMGSEHRRAQMVHDGLDPIPQTDLHLRV
jgi:hypothetical protein